MEKAHGGPSFSRREPLSGDHFRLWQVEQLDDPLPHHDVEGLGVFFRGVRTVDVPIVREASNGDPAGVFILHGQKLVWEEAIPLSMNHVRNPNLAGSNVPTPGVRGTMEPR